MAEKSLLLQILDQIWKEHLLQLDHLRQGIGLRAYGQRDPLNEYKREAFELFEAMLARAARDGDQACSTTSRCASSTPEELAAQQARRSQPQRRPGDAPRSGAGAGRRRSGAAAAAACHGGTGSGRRVMRQPAPQPEPRDPASNWGKVAAQRRPAPAARARNSSSATARSDGGRLRGCPHPELVEG